MIPPPTPRTEASVVNVENKIFIIGGFTPEGISAKVEMLDLTTGVWSERSPLPKALHHTSASTVNGKIYVIGGFESGFWTPVAFNFEYDPAQDRWKTKKTLPTPRGALAAGVIKNKIYIVGGAHKEFFRLVNTDAHEAYDPLTDTWKVLAPLPSPRDQLTVSVVQGILYAIGGRINGDYNKNLNLNEAYNPATGQWTRKANIPTARSGITSQVLEEKILVLGGESAQKTFTENEAYDPKTDTWKTMEPMRKGHHGFGSAVYRGTLHLLTGGPKPGGGGSKFHEIFRLTR